MLLTPNFPIEIGCALGHRSVARTYALHVLNFGPCLAMSSSIARHFGLLLGWQQFQTDMASYFLSGDSSRWFNSRMIRGFLVAAPLIFGALFGNAIASAAAEHSIGSSSLGLKVASFLRGSGLSDEVIVAAIASLPALELRGAIPVGFWMTLPPEKTYVLAVSG